MSARKLAWLDPFIDLSIDSGKKKLPFVFNYFDLLASYFFELVTIVIIARIHHLESNDHSDTAIEVIERIVPAKFTQLAQSPELNQIQSLTAKCLGIIPLDEMAILALRSTALMDRKNCYRRIGDAISVLGDVQILLLALAYGDGDYEEFFELNINLNLNLGINDDD